MAKKLVKLKSGLSIDRLNGEGGAWSPLSIKQHGKVLGWPTTFKDIPNSDHLSEGESRDDYTPGLRLFVQTNA